MGAYCTVTETNEIKNCSLSWTAHNIIFVFSAIAAVLSMMIVYATLSRGMTVMLPLISASLCTGVCLLPSDRIIVQAVSSLFGMAMTLGCLALLF